MNKIKIELPDGVTYCYRNDFRKSKYNRDDLEFDTPEAADELIERIKAAKARASGMPVEGQEVFVLHGDDDIIAVSWDNYSPYCRFSLARGNVFFTLAAAQAEDARRVKSRPESK